MNFKRVSVVLPVRNEEPYIAECLRSLVKQTYPIQSYEIIVVDGCSSDKTREIVAEFEQQFSNMKCLDNPAAVVPISMNIGIRNANGDIIVRADGHNFYPHDYIENCVKYLENTGADNVGGPWLTVSATNTVSARIVASMLSNPFGVGDSRFRTTSTDGFVETVPFGAYRRELFDKIGYFNEKLVRNQDNELNARIRKAGGKIFQAAALQTIYHPVASYKDLLRQTFKQGQWHIFSVSQNRSSMSLRHFIPSIFVSVLVILGIASCVSRYVLLAFCGLLSIYLLTGFFTGLLKSRSYGMLIVGILPFACLFFHLTYGVSALLGFRYLFSAPPRGPIRAGQTVNLNKVIEEPDLKDVAN